MFLFLLVIDLRDLIEYFLFKPNTFFYIVVVFMAENTEANSKNDSFSLDSIIKDKLQIDGENQTTNQQLPQLSNSKQTAETVTDQSQINDDSPQLPNLKSQSNEKFISSSNENFQATERDLQQPISVSIDVNDANEVSIDKKEEKMSNHDETLFILKPEENIQNVLSESQKNDTNDVHHENITTNEENCFVDTTNEMNDRTTSPLSGAIRGTLNQQNEQETEKQQTSEDHYHTDQEMQQNSEPIKQEEDLRPPVRTTPRQRPQSRQQNLSPQKKSQTTILDKKQFISMLKKEQYARPKSMQLHRRRMQSTLPQSQVPTMADDLMKGKNITTNDPIAICDVIDELIGRKITALDNDDYAECHKIDEAINKARMKYRIGDREALYNSVISHLERKKKNAEEQLQNAKREWKEKWKELEQKQKDERDKMYQDHVQQHEDLDDYWKDPYNYYQFNKRSPTQLQHLAIERSLVITGRFQEADQWRKMNEKNEKAEIKEQVRKLTQKYEIERSNLINLQSEDSKQILFQQEVERGLFAEKERRDIDVKKKTLDNIQRHLEEEKNFFNFCARTYKREPSVVLPPTVITTSAFGTGEDIPTMPQGRIFPRGVEDKMRIHQKPRTTPLNLPVLKFKKYKVPRIGEKPKPKDDD